MNVSEKLKYEPSKEDKKKLEPLSSNPKTKDSVIIGLILNGADAPLVDRSITLKNNNYWVYFDLGANIVYIERNISSKVFIQTINSIQHPTKSLTGWKEVPMPKIIIERTQTKEVTTDIKYQSHDYLIAARTGLFNMTKNNGLLQLYTESGNSIPNEEAKKISDLDVTRVKAIAMQESHIGQSKREIKDIFTVNNSGDWKDGELFKSAYGLKISDKPNETESLYYGLRMLASKGFKGGVKVIYDNKEGHTTTNYEFKGWDQATKNYNGGGLKEYEKYVQTMVDNAREPKPSDY